MDNKILPHEVYIIEYGALIRTRCPRDAIDDKMIHQRVLNANLSAGDIIRVQCMDHGYERVLHYAEYLVYDRTSEIRRVEINDRDIRQTEDVQISVVRTVDWKDTPAAKKTEDKGAKTKAA